MLLNSELALSRGLKGASQVEALVFAFSVVSFDSSGFHLYAYALDWS
jgi:hypothetical protein